MQLLSETRVPAAVFERLKRQTLKLPRAVRKLDSKVGDLRQDFGPELHLFLDDVVLKLLDLKFEQMLLHVFPPLLFQDGASPAPVLLVVDLFLLDLDEGFDGCRDRVLDAPIPVTQIVVIKGVAPEQLIVCQIIILVKKIDFLHIIELIARPVNISGIPHIVFVPHDIVGEMHNVRFQVAAGLADGGLHEHLLLRRP